MTSPLNAHERRRLEEVARRRKVEGIPCTQVERAIAVLRWVDARQAAKRQPGLALGGKAA